MKFSFLKEHLQAFPVEAACRVLAVSRSGYYAWRHRPSSRRERRRVELAEKIQAVHERNRGVYGSPRVCRCFRTRAKASVRTRWPR